jgi:hypothetical protein
MAHPGVGETLTSTGREGLVTSMTARPAEPANGCNLKREAIHMKTQLFAALLAMIYATSLSAQPEANQTKAKCAKYLQTPLPPEASSIASPKTWPDCNSYRLYSGIGVTVDYSAARNCAWAERLAIQTGIESEYTVASVFGGSAMLSVLYANGEGVKKTCRLPSASPANRAGQRLRSKTASATWNLCEINPLLPAASSDPATI